MNFIDGLDGLAGGVAAIICGCIAILAFWTGQTTMVILMLALLGSITGFLFFNFHPAKVFMGDGGSMFIGFMIGAGSVVCQAKTAALVGLAVPALAAGLPLFDALFTMVRRGVIWRRSVFTAERGHLHHRLLDKGLGHQTVVFILYGLTLLGAGMGTASLVALGGWRIVLLAGGLALFLATFIALGGARLRETVRAIRRNRQIAHEIRREKGIFEDAQLRVAEAHTLYDWWKAVCLMAAEIHLVEMRLSVRNNGQSGKLLWRPPEGPLREERPSQILTFLLESGDGGEAWMRITLDRNGGFESRGRRMELLGRLLDEYPPPVFGEPLVCGTEDAPAGAVERGTHEDLPRDPGSPGMSNEVHPAK
jgi:UDP-N-acetylmuramyl pentapeptide phosphotransferase/UDP-N-acetylglucosamine-1-phosphate transferase